MNNLLKLRFMSEPKPLKHFKIRKKEKKKTYSNYTTAESTIPTFYYSRATHAGIYKHTAVFEDTIYSRVPK